MPNDITLNYNGYYRNYKEPSITNDDVFGFCYHDYDLHKLSRPSYNGAVRSIRGLPETVSIIDRNGYVLLTEDIQWHWYNWNKLYVNQSEEENKRSFFSLTTSDRAWTNRYGSNSKGGTACANYPCGTNLDKEPMRLFPLLSGGAYIKIIGGIGTEFLTYETMSSTESLDNYSPFTHPHLFYFATNSIRIEIWKNKKTGAIVPEGTTGSIWTEKWIENKVEPFPQFQNKAIVPMISRGIKYNKIESYKVKILPKGSPIPSPFVY